MQNASQNDGTDSDNSTKAVDGSQASSCASPKLGDKTLLSNIPQNFMPELSGSEDEEVSEVESFILDQDNLVDDGEAMLDNSKFLLTSENINDADLKSVDPETQARLEALLEAAGIGKLSTADGKAFADPEVLRRLTSSVSYALDEAAAALTRMRVEQQTSDSTRSLAEACVDGDIGAVRKMLDEGRSVHETTEEGESLLSLACSAGYYELAQVLLAMRANVEDRGIKGDCTPLMEASSGGYVDIVKLLIAHGADVNAQSSAGNTPLHYASCGGHEDVVKELIDSGANVEEHNENGHTPLMEAASAGHVRVAQILLDAGAGINTHSNEFKESALTLACYKGHLEMVKFLLDAGADQEHKTDEMHTALMEASMDGHVEVARLLLDSGAQVNMPADSFESPLTLAACGGHVDLANLLIERGANLEEVNDEGYTPLMEAAREGHEEMIALLLAHGADINAQTEETQETALTLACCGGFLEVADFLINAGADIELGCSTPLMEAAQEGHLELVKYLLKAGAAVHAQTGTGDTALTYACENGHTDVGEVLLNAGAEMEHESEGGRTPLMKAARAGHLCTVKFLISKGADVNRQTSTNDHTVMSLACAGGHLSVVELLLKHQADSGHKLKDGSTMLIEAAKGGHTSVVNLLLDYPNSGLPTTTTSGDLYQQGSPEVQQVPRVPIEGLNNIVPSQDPNQIPLGTTPISSTNVQQGMQVPGQLNLKELNLPGGRTPEQIKKNMQNSLTKKLRNNATLTEGDLAAIKSSMQVSDLDTDLSYDYEKDYAENGSPVPLDLEERPDLKELQRVEQELQEKAQKQLQLNAQRLEQQQQAAAAAAAAAGSKPFQPPASAPFVFPKNINASDTQQALASTVELRKPIPLHVAVQKQLEDLKLKNTSNTAGATGTDSAVVKFEGSSVDTPMPQGAIVSPKAGSQDKVPTPAVFGSGGVDSGAQLGTIALPAGVDLSGTAFESTEKRVVDGAEFSALTAPGLASQVGTGEALFPVIQNSPTSAGAMGMPGSRAGSEEVDLSHVIPRSDKLQPPPPPPLALIQSPSSQAQVAARKKIKPQFKKKPPRPNKQTSSPQMTPGQMGVLQQPAPLLTQPQPGQQTTQIFQQTQTILQKATQQLHQVSLPQGQVPQQQQFTFPQQGLPINAVLDPVTQQLVALNVATTPTANVMGTAAQTNITILPSASSTVGTYSGLTAQLTPQLGSIASANVVTTVSGSFPLQTVTVPTATMPANSIAGNLDHQQQHTLQAQQALKQQLQQELEQQAKLQQERQLLQDQLRLQTQLSQQLFQQQQGQDPQLAMQTHFQTLTQSQAQVTLPAQGQPKVTLQQQQQMQLQEQQLKLQQVLMQQQLQQLQLQNKSQQGQLFQAQQITQYQQQAQQQVANAQQQTAQQVAAQQKNGDKPAKKKKRQNNTPVVTGATSTVVATQSSLLTQQNNMINQQFYCNNTAQTVAGFETVTPPPSTPLTPNPSPASPQLANAVYQPAIELDAETESNHDTALTLACAGGHSELVSLLLQRGADIEHRDKKGFTPLILAATAGHSDVVEILLDHGADIEAQSERTKDTALSLACSGGRYEVVEILLSRGANKEHRNVSDYTPLSLAASGGYVNIIKLLLSHGAEINSRTGSKLGISPLMLAAMNGHTAAVKLLLDMGSDINAQIETNRNTALTLACFQGRHEVVSLLVDRKANIEHRAKTGLTPLMEAASGGYVEVGRVLLDKGADVNAPPVPSSRDTALTIAADKGHYRFVDLLLSRGAAVDVKNKKGNSPLWLACNGGHLDVCQLLVKANADVDSQDNRKVSCLMAAFRKGHIKVVKWMVKQVTQFPSDPECMRFIATVTDKDLLKKCHQCMEIIVSAKARQAAEANKNASILLEELDQERSREESKRAAAARKREKKKKKKKEKMMEKLEKEKGEKDDKNSSSPEPDADKDDDQENDSDENDRGTSEERSVEEQPIEPPVPKIEEEPRISSQPNKGKLAMGHKVPSVEEPERVADESKAQNGSAKGKNRRNKREKSRHENRRKEASIPGDETLPVVKRGVPGVPVGDKVNIVVEKEGIPERRERKTRDNNANIQGINELDNFGPLPGVKTTPREKENARTKKTSSEKTANKILNLDRPESFNMPVASPIKNQKSPGAPSPKRGSKKEDGWKEVVRKYKSRSKKVNVPSTAISRVIGRGGNHINAIREVSGAHIEIDKQKPSGADRIITIKGSAEATRQAHNLIMALIKDPDKELEQIIPRLKNKIAEKKPLQQEVAPPPQPAPAPITLNISTWDNRMAENIGTGGSGTVATSSAATPVPSQKQASSKSSNKTATSSSATTPSSNSNIKTNYTLVKTTNSPLYNIGVFQVPPTTSWAGQPMTSVTSPQRTSQKVTLISTVPPTLTTNSSAMNSLAAARSPSAVSRQLFPNEKNKTSGPEKSVPKTTVTYTMASMAKTKMVTTATTSFAAKVDKTPGSAKNTHGTKSPGVISRPDGLVQPMRGSGAGEVPQMRPTLTSLATVTTTYSTQMTVSSPAVYSPFNNIFSSQVAEQFLGKKEELQENRMNFAQAAAGNAFQTNTPVLQSPASRGPSPPQMAEQDLAKAPGYKGGQRGGSPPNHVMEGDPMKAPGFKGMMSTGSGTPQGLHEVDPSRAPGYRGNHGNHMNHSPRSASSTPVPSHSPRVPPMHGPMMFPPMDSHYMNEYSMPNQPMTLPKIESTLNPNAPDFLSQRSHQIQQYQQLAQQLRSQGHGQGQPPGMSATPPPFGMGVSRPPVFHTPPPGSAAQASMPLQLAGLPAAMALSDLPGNSISGLPMSAFQGLPRQFGPVPAVGRQVNSSAMLTPSKDTGSPRSAVSETPSMTNDHISPSDGGGGVASEPKMRPIGTERRQRPIGPPSVDSGSMAAMWSNGGAGDVNEWGMGGVSSRSVSLGGDLPDAAASHPAGLPPGVLPAASVYPPDSADQRLDHNFQGAAPLLTAFPNLTMFTNGIPPNAGPLPPAVSNPLPTGQLGPGPGGGGDALGRGWNPQLKGGISDTVHDSKVNWNSWSPANGM